MKPLQKNLLITGGLILGAILAFGYRKVTTLQFAFDNMTIAPYWIDNPKIGLTKSSFSLDVILRNNSAEHFEVSGGGIAYLKRIEIILNNQIIGIASVNMDELSIPAFQYKILQNIPVVVNTSVIINNLTNLPQLAKEMQLIGYVDVLGTEYQIS